MQRVIKSPSTIVLYRTGSEGPKHDPYSFKELEVQKDGEVICFHEGLGDWIAVGKQVYRGLVDPREMFEARTGITFRMVERWFQHLESRCKKCGSRKLEWMKGMPGESLLLCVDCDAIVGSEFNKSEIE